MSNQHTPYRQWLKRALQKAIDDGRQQPLLSLGEAKTILALAEKPMTPAIGSRNDGTKRARPFTSRCGVCGSPLIRTCEVGICFRCEPEEAAGHKPATTQHYSV